MSQPLSLNDPSRLTVFCSVGAFGNPPRARVFFQNVANWLPSGLITWFFERNQSPGLVNLRQNRDEAYRIAWALIDAKREEVKAGTSRRDVMGLLGSNSSAQNRKSGAYVVSQSKRVLPYDRNGG